MPATDHLLRPLFEPHGVIVAGASTHPGRFGSVALHNLLSGGYQGPVFATSRDGAEILGVQTVRSVDELPPHAAELVIVCTPISANVELLRACARIGVRAAFVAAAGYAEVGKHGLQAEADLLTAARKSGIILAGPNGQGLVSTPNALCAQIVAPLPPKGAIAVASQSGNLTSAFMNFARQTAIGISRAVSVGNAAQLSTFDYLDYFATDPATRVSLAYLESIPADGQFLPRVQQLTQQKPLVLLKGGVSSLGQRAAQSHTGALATNNAVFAAACRQAGAIRAATPAEAFDAAATFATQPLPTGPNVVVITTVGGWGVLAADAIARSSLTLLPLPDDLHTALDRLLPPRWSRNNPIDTAAGETRDTIPELLTLVAAHTDVHAVILLGVGIQSNQARLIRDGRFYPDHGLARIVDFHERQDRRYAQLAADISDATGKPILIASELADTAPDNPGPSAVRASGRLCYPSPQRAVRALDHLWRDARRRTQRDQ